MRIAARYFFCAAALTASVTALERGGRSGSRGLRPAPRHAAGASHLGLELAILLGQVHLPGLAHRGDLRLDLFSLGGHLLDINLAIRGRQAAQRLGKLVFRQVVQLDLVRLDRIDQVPVGVEVLAGRLEGRPGRRRPDRRPGCVDVLLGLTLGRLLPLLGIAVSEVSGVELYP